MSKRPINPGPRACAAVALAAALACSGGGTPSDPLDPGGEPSVPPPATDPSGFTEVASGELDGLRVRVRSDRTLGTGLAVLAISVEDGAGAKVTGAEVTFSAARVSSAGGLSAAVLRPPAIAPDGSYRLEAAFAEAAAAADGYALSVGVARPGEAAAVAALGPVAVRERHLAEIYGPADRRQLLAVRFDAALRVGVNPITLSLHESADGGASWTPVEGATFTVVPWMPSMGHGGAGSVPPVPAGAPGRYAGAVGLSMTGDWEVTFGVFREGVEVGQARIAFYF